jgi:hypothetical protein
MRGGPTMSASIPQTNKVQIVQMDVLTSQAEMTSNLEVRLAMQNKLISIRSVHIHIHVHINEQMNNSKIDSRPFTRLTASFTAFFVYFLNVGFISGNGASHLNAVPRSP